MKVETKLTNKAVVDRLWSMYVEAQQIRLNALKFILGLVMD
ncbi:MAG: hypothetical protein QW745_08215 [Thermoplasmata archaeon]